MKTQIPISWRYSKVITIIFLAIFNGCSTSHQMKAGNISAWEGYDSVVVDNNGNRYPLKLFRENTLWMTSNLNVDLPGSYCYNDSEKYCEQYGRLYTWKLAQERCSALGENWRLPSKDEWQRLAGVHAGESTDSNEIRKRAYQSLMLDGDAQFNAKLGGGRSPGGVYARLEAHGFYWTASQENDSAAWFINFAKGSQSLYINDGEKSRAISVRCVKSIDTLK